VVLKVILTLMPFNNLVMILVPLLLKVKEAHAFILFYTSAFISLILWNVC
jgi:hypothetical protein